MEAENQGEKSLSCENSATAVFLAFDDSTYVTGIELFVDGSVAQIWRSQDDAQVAPVPGSLRSTAPTVLGR